MNSVKTYNKINKNDEKLNFSISKMEDIYDDGAVQKKIILEQISTTQLNNKEICKWWQRKLG